MTYSEIDSAVKSFVAVQGPVERTVAEARLAAAERRVIAGDLRPFALYDLKCWQSIVGKRAPVARAEAA